MPVGSNISKRLTRIAIQRGINQIFTHGAVPGVQFDAETGEYESWDAGLFVGENASANANYGVRNIDGRYRSFDFGVSKAEFVMQEFYSYKEFDFREGHTDVGMAIFDKAMQAVHQRHGIAREMALNTCLFTDANWGGGTAVAAGNRFSNTSSNPPGYIRQQVTAIRKSSAAGSGGILHMWMPVAVYDILAQHPVYTKLDPTAEITGFATHDTIAASLGVAPANLHVPMGVYNEQRKGETAANAFIFAASDLWMGFVPATLQESAQTAFGYIYLGSDGPTVRRGEVDNGERHYRWMRESSIGVYKPVDTAAGALLTDIVA
jgi:hypothetical protein